MYLNNATFNFKSQETQIIFLTMSYIFFCLNSIFLNFSLQLEFMI